MVDIKTGAVKYDYHGFVLYFILQEQLNKKFPFLNMNFKLKKTIS